MKTRRLLTLLIVILVILPSSIFVSANETEEPVNFDTVDWESYDISIEDLPQLSEWMKTAQLSSLFRAYKYMDGGYAYPYLDQLSIRMKNDFAGFIAALSQEDAEKQQKIANTLSAIIYNENDDQIKKDEFPDMVYSVKVSGSKQQYTLGLFKDEVEKYWGIPRTGDRFPVAETALCIVSLSLICLLTLDHRRRKYN